MGLLKTVVFILALVCFLLAAVGVTSKVNLEPLGLACLTVALLL